MERELLILGLLKAQSQHGYKINEFIEKNLGRVSNMKKATAYSILKRLEKEGYAESSPGQEGNRPTKLVYSITEKGEKRFEKLLREVLASTDETIPAFEIGMMFIDHESVRDALACLKGRLENTERLLDTYRNAPKHPNGLGIDLAIDRRIRMYEADRDWLKETIALLKKQTEIDPN
ncbi:PadR family transcriptional regulator [Paenibacillus cisolokensis]|uniref:PadR family transcriptional regulator n=1 Tax=Paenibacillus cisolokensis TaxID=1658519 RepID=A0ABQ4NDR5_9BACL|nr:PadR family transcriptional regulator [Paenibacillus cisolokensis]GIQ66368.1 PadR family transcriptional regulator [Paenibacillus cisolokensis]